MSLEFVVTLRIPGSPRKTQGPNHGSRGLSGLHLGLGPPIEHETSEKEKGKKILELMTTLLHGVASELAVPQEALRPLFVLKASRHGSG